MRKELLKRVNHKTNKQLAISNQNLVRSTAIRILSSLGSLEKMNNILVKKKKKMVQETH